MRSFYLQTGTPDNARPLPDGSGILVALYTVFEEDRPPLTKLMAAAPLFRKLVARLHRLVEIPFEYLNSLSPNIIFEEILYNVSLKLTPIIFLYSL